MANWQKLRAALRKKLNAECESKKKHDFWYVSHQGNVIARIKDVHGKGEMRPWELGNVARSMAVTESDVKAFAACPLSGEEYLAMVLGH